MSFEEIRRRIEKIHKKIVEEIERSFEEATSMSLFQQGSMRPLYTVYQRPDAYVVLVDLAGADTSSLEIKPMEDKLIIRASLEKEVRFSDIYGTMIGEDVVFHEYEHEIPLPPDADTSSIKYNIRPNKIVEIIIPRRRSSLNR